MTKRLYRPSSSSSSSSSHASSEEADDFDLYSSAVRKACRTRVTGRYQSDIYTGLISADRTYANGQRLTRLEQLITLYHDDQIRPLLLVLRHYAMKHRWQDVLFYLKSLLQSSFCRAYMRLYWQMIFRYVLEHSHRQHLQQLDLNALPQIFTNLFHSPTINRTQTFFSYLCLYLLNPHTRHLYTDMETRYKSLPQPFFSGRCQHAAYLRPFDQKLEQLVLIHLHFLYDYRQWLEDYSVLPTLVNPFEKTIKISLEDERDLELWTFKLATNFQEIQFISNEYFDNYDPYLLKYLHFLFLTETNIEQIPDILDTYLQQHRNYLNAYKYHYWFHFDLNSLKKLIELDPSASPYVLLYCRAVSNPIEILDRLFDYLDFEKNKRDYEAWNSLAKLFAMLDLDDRKVIQCLRENWTIRRNIWRKFHFQGFDKIDSDKAAVAYVLLDQQAVRIHLRETYLEHVDLEQADRLHDRLMTTND